MRYDVGRFRRPMRRSTEGQLMSLISLGDGSTLSIDFTTGVLHPRLAFRRASGGTYTGNDGLVYGVDFATSGSLAIGIGSKSVTLTATANVDRRYLVGQTVYISNGANNMSGPVTAYNASTQVLTIDATSANGSGSFTSWTVGNASARFDYDPTTLAPNGLLIEAAANNTISNSNTIYTGAWGGSLGITATQDTTIPDPSGGTTTCKIVKSAGIQYVVRNQPIPTLTVPANSTVNLTASVWLRMDGANQVAVSLGIFDGSSFGTRSGASVSNSAVTISSGSSADAEFTFGTVTGWVRCSISRSFTNATASPISFSTLQFYIYPNRLNTNATTIYAWGAQAETGIGPSSLIPTVASTGNRQADFCSIVSPNFEPWYGSPTGWTIVADMTPQSRADGSSPGMLALRSAADSGLRIYYYNDGTYNTAFRFATASTGVEVYGPNGVTYGVPRKFGASVTSGTQFASSAGVQIGSTQTLAVPMDQVLLAIGNDGVSPTPAVNCRMHFRSIKYWPYAMTLADLNARTT